MSLKASEENLKAEKDTGAGKKLERKAERSERA